MVQTAPAPTWPPVLGSRVRWPAVWFWAAILAACITSGVFYAAVSDHGRPWVGATYGGCCGGGVMLFEQGLLMPRFRARLRRLPWLASVLVTEAAYLGLIMTGAALAGMLLLALGVLHEPLHEALVLGLASTLYALVVSGILITLIRMRDLIGAEVFRNILLGRYYHPVEEERIFVFLDLMGSTAYAQAHGDLRAQAFLASIFAALAEPVRRHGGSIDDYVGDMALITWPMASGVEEARCVTCVFAFLQAIATGAAAWQRDFGQVPAFRAALHGGAVVTAEIGVDRHKITYFGDVVNTTGRIETLCRTLDTPVLISSELLDRLPSLPHGIRARSLGSHAIKGRGQVLNVLSLELTPGERYGT